MHPGLMLLLAANELTPVACTVSVPSAAVKVGYTANISANPVTATVVGGIGPFTYHWVAALQGGSINVTILNAYTATATLRITGSLTDDYGLADVTCTVADTGNGGAVTVSNVCEVHITNLG